MRMEVRSSQKRLVVARARQQLSVVLVRMAQVSIGV